MITHGLRLAACGVMRGWLRTYHRLRITGRENLPARGPFVLVANHASHLDAMCLLSAMPVKAIHTTFPAAAHDYFFESLPRLALAAVVINALPFHRQTHIRQSIVLCRHLLEGEGSRNVLVLFPEGTRGGKAGDGAVGPFKGGIGMLVAGTRVPVVPCHLEGSGRAWPRGTWLPRPRAIRLRIGRPRVYGDVASGKANAQWIADDLRRAVLTLGCGADGRGDAAV